MKNIKLFCCLSLIYSVAFSAQSTSIRQPQLNTMLSQLIYQYNIPGAVLTYGFKGKPLHTIAVGFSDIAQQRAMTNDKLFITGSVTKSFIGVAIIELIKQHKITVDETVGEIARQYGGELKDTVKQYPTLAPVTIRQLLVHTSGVPEDINTENFAEAFIADPKKSWNDQSLLAIAMQHPFYFKPGDPGKWSYTNTDYLLLGIVLKSVTKESMSEIFIDLWQQAHLDHIYYSDNGVIPETVLKNLSIGYLPVNAATGLSAAFKNLPTVTIPGADKNSKAYVLDNAYTISTPSAGGIITNTETLAKWYRALFQEGMLDQASIKMMLAGVKNGYPFQIPG